jgi:hypothetical protein
MEWATIAGLVLQYGIPFTEFLIQKINSKGTVTAEEWAALKAMANVSAKSELQDRLKAAGIDPNSSQGQALIALVPDAAPSLQFSVLPTAPPSAPQ